MEELRNHSLLRTWKWQKKTRRSLGSKNAARFWTACSVNASHDDAEVSQTWLVEARKAVTP